MFPKKLFNKIKLDHFFKKAGRGHRLDEESSNQAISSPRCEVATSSRTESEETRRAADAAIARYQQNKKGPCHPTMRTHMRSDLEASIQSQQNKTDQSASPKRENSPSTSVLFKCPDIGPAVLPKQEMNDYIREFLYNQLAEQPGMASALMIQTLNKNRENVKICIDILIKYIDNLLNNPNEEKFRRIRVNNKAFKDKVSPIEGSEEFLQSCGFERKTLPFEDQASEVFLTISEESALNSEHLEEMKGFLLSAEPIRPQLDRALHVYHPSRMIPNFVVPDEFYNLTPAELKKEQQMRTDTVEKLEILRTKAMRERDEQRELRRYRYTLIRIRFPDGILLEGTFKATEKLPALFDFVRENLLHEWLPYLLVTSIGQKLVEEESTFAELGLVPSAVVNFTLEEDIVSDISAQQSSFNKNGPFLKPKIQCLIQELR